MKILILDPDTARQRQLRLILGSLGRKSSEILAVADPKDAVRVIRGGAVGCCFFTLSRPHFDPLATIGEIRSTDAFKRLPIITVGVNAVAEDVAEAARAGVTYFLTYPFTADNVQVALRAAVR